jgi:predicted PurR-regulated permease PerM
MWGVMVALLNFVPYLGALTGIICMTIGAALSFDSLEYAFVFPAVYLSFGVLEGSFVTPWIMGRSLTLNPVIILLSLTFWGWIWGIVGIILAVPILAAFKILCAHVKPMEPLAEFLSGRDTAKTLCLLANVRNTSLLSRRSVQIHRSFSYSLATVKSETRAVAG